MTFCRNLIAGILGLCALVAHADDATAKILDCMRGNIPDALRIQQVEMTATDRTGGNRLLRGKVYALKDGPMTRAMLKIDAPSDLNGAAYLMRSSGADRPEEIYFYLPSLGRVRRIAGASAGNSLLGTDFSYDEMKELQTAFASSTATLDKPDTIEQRPVHVLSILPATSTPSRYSAVKAWVDQKTCVALKIEFYEGKDVRKQLTAPVAGLQQSSKYWYASEAVMRDFKEKTQTRLKVIGVTEGATMPSSLFDPHSFYLGG